VRRLIIDRDDACVEVNKQSARLDHHPECPLDRHTIA
jgi:hypothetical protein